MRSAAGGPPAGDPLRRVHWADVTRTFAGSREDTRAARVFRARDARALAWASKPLAADAALVVTELATNAVLHAGSAFSVSLTLSSGAIRSAWVTLSPSGRPAGKAAGRHSRPRPGRDRGHGDSLGVESAPSGKAVWPELPLPDQLGPGSTTPDVTGPRLETGRSTGPG